MGEPKLWRIPAGPPPAPTSVALGSVLSDPDLPTHPLNYLSPAPIPSITGNSITPWTYDSDVSRWISAGIDAQFLAPLGFGADLAAKHTKGARLVVTAEQLDTSVCRLGKEYVAAALAEEDVREWRARHWRWRPLYVVDGIMVAKQAEWRVVRGRERGGEVGFKVDPGIAAGVATGVQVGPYVGLAEQERLRMGGGCENFVFAYRLCRVRMRWDGSYKRAPEKGGMFDSSAAEEREESGYEDEFVMEDDEE